MSSKKKSRSRRKPCAGAKKSQCGKRTNCTWKKSKIKKLYGVTQELYTA